MALIGGNAPVYDTLAEFDEDSSNRALEVMGDEENFIIGFKQRDNLLWRFSSRVFLTDKRIFVYKPGLFSFETETETYLLDRINKMETELDGSRVTIQGPDFEKEFFVRVREGAPRFDDELREQINRRAE
jgi:hypothetical protein